MKIRCGTRGSQLALKQTQLVIDALVQRHQQIEIERKQGTAAASFSNKKDRSMILS